MINFRKVSYWLGIVTLLLTINSCDDGNVKPGDTSTFIKFFGGPYDNEAYDVNVMSDGYVLAGRVQNVNSAGAADDYDFRVIRTDQFGNQRWGVTLGDSLDDAAGSVIATSDGGIVALGTYSLSAAQSKMFVVKLDDNGNILWSRNIGGQFPFYGGNDICELASGEFVVAGYSKTSTSTAKNLQFFKLDATGIPIDSSVYGGNSNDDEAFQIYEKYSDLDGEYEYVIAASIGSSIGGVQGAAGGTQLAAIILLAQNLDVKDGRGIGGGLGSTFGYGVTHTNDTTYYLVGSSNALAPNFGGFDAFLSKFRRPPSGLTDSVWTVKYGVAGEDAANDIIYVSGNFIIGGYRGPESMLIKTNTQGHTHILDCNSSQTDITENDFCHLNASRKSSDENLWFRTFGSIAQQMDGKINSVTSALDDGFIMAGSSRFANTTMMALTKTDVNGEIGK